ncbi:DUF732 domain-containing protein [Rhodococcus sp. BP22]|uniref:DUF732 domain-containing protein n=1 Tax=Rhodococcus sp. BP22 TaxID=2758566 RepID=UPI001644DFE6|nr:DUF732 domain-containing protein [Rhodococcus sp. BP22]
MANKSNAAENLNFKPVLIVVCIIGLIIFAIVQACSGGEGQDNASSDSPTASRSWPSESIDIVPAPPAPMNPEDMVPGVDYNPDEVYLTNLRLGGVPVGEEADALTVAHGICDGLDSGVDIRRYQAAGTGSGLTTDQASYTIGAAVNAYCPQYEYMLN